MSVKMFNLSNLQTVEFPIFDGQDSFLVVYEGEKTIPFSMSRLFMVKSSEKNTRGFHAHKECTQLLVALNGECKITCDDGKIRKEKVLSHPSEGLLVPPTIWAEQEYQPNTILMVLTDSPYDPNDYIRDYNAFLEFRNPK